jgi:hypothetical protein
MPTLFNRVYQRPVSAVSRREKLTGLGLLLLLALTITAVAWQVLADRTPLFDVPAPAAPRAVPTPRLPPLKDAAWQGPKHTRRFAPDDLYTKINGRADFFLQRGLTALDFGTYQRAADGRRVDVYRYEMDTPADAARTFADEKPPNAAPLDLGDQAYTAPGAVYVQAGSAYLQVLADAPDESGTQAALDVAADLVTAETSTPGN